MSKCGRKVLSGLPAIADSGTDTSEPNVVLVASLVVILYKKKIFIYFITYMYV